MRAFLCLVLLGCSGPNTDKTDAGDGGNPILDSGSSDGDATTDAPSEGGGLDCDAGGCVRVLVFRRLFLSDTDRSFAQSTTAWKTFGLDIDGKTTTAQSSDVCTRANGAPSSIQVDGNNGIDNSWGASIVPIIQSAASIPNMSKPASDAIETGAAATLGLRVDMLGSALDYAMLSGSSYKMFGLPSPSWMGNDPWAASSRSVTNGNLSAPKVAFPSGSMTARVYASGVAMGTANLEIAIGGLAFTLPLRHLAIQAKIAADNGSAIEGQISGVMNTEEFVAALKQVIGQINPSYCTGVFDGLAQQIRQTSDILSDGTQDPQKACDAISVGIGFEATAANLTAVVTDPAPPMPCP